MKLGKVNLQCIIKLAKTSQYFKNWSFYLANDLRGNFEDKL